MCLSVSDNEWSLATLSTKLGGLGLRSVERHSPAGFLASQESCHASCRKIDNCYVWNPSDAQSDVFAAGHDYNIEVEPSDQITNTIPRQQHLSASLDKHQLLQLRERRRNDCHYQAHLNHIGSSGASQWLHVLPSKALRTSVDPQLFRVMIQRQPRVPIFGCEFHCPQCDDVMDRFGDHCLVCSCGGDRTKRHNLIRNNVFQFCVSANLNPKLERPGLIQPRPLCGSSQENGATADNNSNRRPADVYLPRWRRGGPAALDFIVTSGLGEDRVRRSSVDGSSAVCAYEDFKRTYMDIGAACQAEGIAFIPVFCEADGGGWGPAAHKTWNELAKRKCLITGEREFTVAVQLLQNLGLILHR